MLDPKMIDTINSALNKAEYIHPVFVHTNCLYEATSILGEEVGEFAKAVNDFHSGTGTKLQIKSELLDCVAVCIRAIKMLDEIYE